MFSAKGIPQVWGLAFCLCAGLPGLTKAQDFYAGKTVDMVVGYPPGGSNDLYARLVAQFIGEHIPGRPRIVVQNMPGGGSLLAANHIFNVVPKDGTVLGAVSQGIPLQAKLGHPQARFDPVKFNWIGRSAPSSNVTMVWRDWGFVPEEFDHAAWQLSGSGLVSSCGGVVCPQKEATGA